MGEELRLFGAPMKIPDRAGPRGWYKSKGGRPIFWTGIKHPENATGLCYLLQVQRHGPNGSLRKIAAAKYYLWSLPIRVFTRGGQIEVPAEIDGLPTAEAVKVAESGR
jgi:hypothetical protein